MKNAKNNPWLLAAGVSASIYFAYLIYVVTTLYQQAATSNAFGNLAITMIILIPHALCLILALLCNISNLFAHQRVLALSSVLLYLAAGLLMPIYAYYVGIPLVLSVVGYVLERKQAPQEAI